MIRFPALYLPNKKYHVVLLLRVSHKFLVPNYVQAATIASTMERRLLPFFSRIHGSSELQQFGHRVDARLPYRQADQNTVSLK